jgi:hypothetical protein
MFLMRPAAEADQAEIGWHLARAVDRRGVTAYLLTRRTQRQPDLAGRITDQHAASELRAGVIRN